MGAQRERRHGDDLAAGRADAAASFRRSRSAGRRATSSLRSTRSGWVRREGRVFRVEPELGSRRVELDASERRRGARVRRRLRRRVARRRPRTPSGPEAVAPSRASIRRPSSCDRARARPGGRWPSGSARSGCSAAGSSGCPPATMRSSGDGRAVGGCARVAAGFGSVWVSDDEGEAVIRVDPQQEAIAAHVRRRRQPVRPRGRRGRRVGGERRRHRRPHRSRARTT